MELALVRFISIHAPQWGATGTRYNTVYSLLFQSTHPSGVRLIRTTQWNHCQDFNPRTPVGCDYHSAADAVNQRDFNPRTPVGCDLAAVDGSNLTYQFQSTHPSGVRQAMRRRRPRDALFQSTHPSGVRPCPSRPSTPSTWISIHAPQWGATSTSRQSADTAVNFNPRTPVGCDRRLLYSLFCNIYFNPRTPVGCDAIPRSQGTSRPDISIHAPQWGATII